MELNNMDLGAKKLIARRFLDFIRSHVDFNQKSYDDLIARCRQSAINAVDEFDEDIFILYYLYRNIFKLSKEHVSTLTSPVTAYDELLTLINENFDHFVEKEIDKAEVLYVFSESPTLH